jgi:hypothetical protein
MKYILLQKETGFFFQFHNKNNSNILEMMFNASNFN